MLLFEKIYSSATIVPWSGCLWNFKIPLILSIAIILIQTTQTTAILKGFFLLHLKVEGSGLGTGCIHDVVIIERSRIVSHNLRSVLMAHKILKDPFWRFGGYYSGITHLSKTHILWLSTKMMEFLKFQNVIPQKTADFCFSFSTTILLAWLLPIPIVQTCHCPSWIFWESQLSHLKLLALSFFSRILTCIYGLLGGGCDSTLDFFSTILDSGAYKGKGALSPS